MIQSMGFKMNKRLNFGYSLCSIITLIVIGFLVVAITDYHSSSIEVNAAESKSCHHVGRIGLSIDSIVIGRFDNKLKKKILYGFDIQLSPTEVRIFIKENNAPYHMSIVITDNDYCVKFWRVISFIEYAKLIGIDYDWRVR